MVVIILQVLGGLAFSAGTLVLGLWLRRHPTREGAERSSRISHTLYWVALVLPGFAGVLYPGLTHFDEILGIPSLPLRPVAQVLGALAILAGLYLSFAAQVPLRRQGDGANAFTLTKRVVTGDIYARTRNPMSLGYYLLCVGLGLIAGSTYITLGSLLGVVPVHLFNLLYFEEYELALRLGKPYLEYRERVPFLFPRLGSASSVE
ncbi:MAG: isoprenylcysteine carboxylmethyltransferase family protein [Anaerolineae bacterium]|jgi:protein-S-isoprenylcysteine O-methyltransferase Ste14